MKTEIAHTQIAFLYQTTFAGSFEGLASDYLKKYPSTLVRKAPFPDDFPDDSLPRLEITHNDKNVKIGFAKNRADIYFDSSSVDEVIWKDLVTLILGLKLTIARIGYVQKTIYTEISTEYITEKLPMLSDKIVQYEDLREASQKINKKVLLDSADEKGSMDCNSNATLILGKKDGKDALLLERDINTHPSINLSEDNAERIDSLVKVLKEEANQTLFTM